MHSEFVVRIGINYSSEFCNKHSDDAALQVKLPVLRYE